MAYSKVRNIFTRSYPLLGNMATCGSLYGLGDLSQQTIFKTKEEKYDLVGTKRIAAMSFFGFGPIYHFWYKLLDKRLPGTGVRMVVTKLILDQTVCTPVCLSIFFIGLSYLEGQHDLLADLRSKGLKAFVTGCAFWPAAQTVNFAVCPPHLRTAYVSSCAFVWSNILCYIKDGQTKEDPDSAETVQLVPEPSA